MRVLFACSDLLGHAVFAERHLDALTRHAPEVDASLLTPGAAYRSDAVARWMLRLWASPRLRLPERGRTSWRCRTESIHSRTIARAVRRRLRTGRFDLVHFHTQTLAFRAREAAGELPWVVSMDATNALLARTTPAAAHTFEGSAGIERAALQHADAAVGWSEWVAVSLREDIGLPPGRVRVIPPAVPVAAAAREVREADGPVRVLFVGNDFRRKGGEVLLDAAARLPPGLVELDIVTNDRSPPEPGPHTRVHRGVRYRDEVLDRLYGAADVFALPSQEECYGIALSEAMGRGLPILSTRVMAIPDVVRHGRDGLLVPAGDAVALSEALMTLAYDPGLRASMGASGWERAAAHCSARVTAEAWSALYSAVAGAGDRIRA